MKNQLCYTGSTTVSLNASRGHERQKKQKRVAKALYHGKRTQTVAPGKNDDDAKQKEEMPDTKESTCSQEDKDQENQAQSTATILNMDREEFQKLQENESTLESIRKLVREGTTTGNTGKLFQ